MLIEFQPGTVVLAMRDEFHVKTDSLLRLIAVRNVSIEGNGAVLQMRRGEHHFVILQEIAIYTLKTIPTLD
jgi:hypothetical protein